MPPGIIRSKLAVPPLAENVVARPRLAMRIASLVTGHQVTLIAATPGSGKTTAVVQAISQIRLPTVWLTIDSVDQAAGRFLAYLEAGFADVTPAASGVATAALSARLPHAEAAGLLAQATEDVPMLVVLDGMENLTAPDGRHALSTLGALIRYAPESLRFLLLSRVEVPFDLTGLTAPENYASLGETELAFTSDEATEALAAIGAVDAQVEEAVAQTGGWVTGVLFEAWRSQDHVAGSGGELDPLHGYLASQILDRLPHDERELLISTSLLDEVTADRGNALGVGNAAALLYELRSKHLPVVWARDTHRMRCHPRFREFLLTQLDRRHPDDIARLRRAYGHLLAAEGHPREAVEEFLASGSRDDALAAAAEAIGTVIEQLDLDVAERWVAQLATDGGHLDLRLTDAEIVLAIAREDFGSAVATADRLRDAGVRAELARREPKAASMMVWAYWHLDRLDDAREVLSNACPSPEVEAVRYLMNLVESDDSGEAPDPVPTGTALDALIARVHYSHGRLSDVLDVPGSQWTLAVSAPWRAGALRASGRLSEALELYRSGDGDWAAAWMRGIVGPEILIDLGRTAEARAAISQGRQLIRASGSVVFLWLSRLIEAKLELRLVHDPRRAMEILDQLERAGARRYGFLSDFLDTWRGLALLQTDDNTGALDVLERLVDTMEATDRILELPTASVYLAEARWRLEDAAGADRAADGALAASVRQGSNHQLLLALSDFSAVLSRRLDAEPGVDSPWHEVGRQLMTSGFSPENESPTTIFLTEFGEIGMSVDGRRVRPRIAKSLVLLAYLASTHPRRVTRDDLMTILFDGRDDQSTRSYLRQTVHRLREVLPDGVGPTFEGGELIFSRPVRLESDSMSMLRLLSSASRLRGAEQHRVLLEALDLYERGEYMPGSDSPWVVQRRAELAQLASHAQLQAASSAFAAERFVDAEELARKAVKQDPYQESAWRLLMRIAAAVGDEDRIIDAYRRCHEALAELGAEPSEATRKLLDSFRR